MIFVTVGNATDPFKRLLDEVDRLAGAGIFGGHQVMVQSGNNATFNPAHCMKIPFMKMEDFMKAVEEADLVICHGGAGTLLHVLNRGKVPVVMPRRVRYGEVVDDHQLELVTALAEQGRIVAALEPTDLAAAIGAARHRQAATAVTSAPPMVALVAQAIEELLAQ
jgi:UDP-N-acetylglucosamine transferase subunit ALG13